MLPPVANPISLTQISKTKIIGSAKDDARQIRKKLKPKGKCRRIAYVDPVTGLDYPWVTEEVEKCKQAKETLGAKFSMRAYANRTQCTMHREALKKRIEGNHDQ